MTPSAPTPEATSVQGMLSGMYAAIELLKMRDKVLNASTHKQETCTVCCGQDR
jgi:hypothetical protein